MSLRHRGGATVAAEGDGATGSGSGSKQMRHRGVVKSDNDNEGNNGKGGGSGVMRSTDSSRHRLRRRKQHHEEQRGGTAMAGGSGRKVSNHVSVLGAIAVIGDEEGTRVPQWQRRARPRRRFRWLQRQRKQGVGTVGGVAMATMEEKAEEAKEEDSDSVGAIGDSDRGLAGGDNGRGWATAAEGWLMVDEERKKGRDVEDISRADGGEEATVGGSGEDGQREEVAGASAFGATATVGASDSSREEEGGRLRACFGKVLGMVKVRERRFQIWKRC
ncbi:hypothetical protein BHM03_00039186 [Ensete ventricosum]|nr:hypothetical protein BHM03_00039186 [Ensete ventricosum]